MRVLLGVSGGIAAYKSAEIVRAFKKRGDEVRVIMTGGAQEFIAPLTLQVLSEETVGTELFDPTYESEIGHIELARWPDLILVAPATANLIARVANGMADDLLTTVLMATTAPVVVAPAMNTQMYRNALFQKNLQVLKDAGITIVDPDAGELACKEVGPGRLPDAEVLLDAVDAVVTPQRLAGLHVLITAGPTREHIDPARFLSNPSTGKMGYALARAARLMGAKVTLISGPVTLLPPYGVDLINVLSAQQMYDAVMDHVGSVDIVIKAAAVADLRPDAHFDSKQEKSTLDEQLALVRNPDILASLGAKSPRPFLVGFAAETHDVVARAREKRVKKKADMIVANQVGGIASGFAADTNQVTIMDDQGETKLGPGEKTALAVEIMERISAAYQKKSAP